MSTQTLPPAPSGTDAATPTTTTSMPHRRDFPLRRVWRGPADDAPWVRPALLGLLGATALLYLWGLGASGWANSFYSAAAQAGSASWKAFFFGSSDAANAITVDKPPMALWVMATSVRIFGLSSWSILVPQALMGVGSVGLLYATVRRTTRSPGAGLLAGGILATTPVAALMFRFDNPDALLVLLLVGSVAATLRAVDETSVRERMGHPVRWLAIAGMLVGFAFLTKMLQAFLVLPGLGLGYLLAANTDVVRRLKHLGVAVLAMVVSAGWWVAIVALWPASSRPYIGGSQNNSILELTLGYNGFGRITGDETGSVGGGAGWGETGLLRLLDSESGGQIGWLLPTSVLLLVAGLWATRSASRTDRVRAGLVVWGAWLIVTALTFSFMQGIFHAYYTVVLAPAIAALVAIGGWLLWTRRSSDAAAVTLAAATALTSTLAFSMLDRTPSYHPWLRWMILLVGLGVALLIGVVRRLPRRVGLALAALAVVTGLAAPAAYSLTTVATPHAGSIPTAGPTTAGGQAGAQGRFGGAGPATATGGLLRASTPSASLARLLTTNAADYDWVAAAVGSNAASGYQLATTKPVMAIGGFNGSDPSPTLAQFQEYVAGGRIHYFIASGDGGGAGNGGGGGPSASGSTSSEITSWVTSTFTPQTVDGVTVYDLTAGS